MSDYIEVCPADDIPDGKRDVFNVNDHWVAIFNVGGRYYAVEDLCPHDDNILTEDEHGRPVPLKDETIIACPRHGAKFDISSGKALTPAITAIDIPFYQVRVNDNNMIEIESP